MKRKAFSKSIKKLLLPLAVVMPAAVIVLPVQASSPLMPTIPAFRTAQIGEMPILKMNTPFPKVEATMPIFSINALGDSSKYFSEVAQRLELDGKVLNNGKGKMASRMLAGEHEQQTLTMFDASGGFFYRFDHQLHAVPERQLALPSEDEAYKIALDYLESRGLLPKDAVIDREQVTFSTPRLTEFDGKSGKTLNEYLTSIEVRFSQAWNGYPVTGPGSKLYVAIGDKGKVVGVTKMWRESNKTQSYLQTIPPELALQGLNEKQGQLSTPVGCAEANVEAMALAYWVDNPKHSQRVSFPLYRISGTCYSAKGQSLGGFEGYAPALVNNDLNLNTQRDNPDLNQDVDI